MTKDLDKTSNHQSKGIIVLDCDGVLLDYHSTFADIYHRTFGKQLAIVSPNSYHAREMYGIQWDNPEEKKLFDEMWDNYGWKTMPKYDGAVEACQLLHQSGYELVCVTAMPAKFIEHRLENFRSHGFPIDRIISSGYHPHDFNVNPKREIIEELNPIAFVDDLRRNFKDIQNVQTKFIFIDRQYHDDPNRNHQIFYHRKYFSLFEFVQDFLHQDEQLHQQFSQSRDKSSSDSNLHS